MGKNRIVQKLIRIMAVALICMLDIVCSVSYIYYKKSNNSLISVKNASDNLFGIFSQNIITNLFGIILLLLMIVLLRNKFMMEMALKVENKRQVKSVVLLVVILLGMTVDLLVMKKDTTTIIYNLFYYLFFVAFFEEFVVRGVCVYLMKDFSTVCRYFVPNLLFGIMHIFSYSDFAILSREYVFQFIITDLLGLILMGCLFQFIKEKTGTLWSSILVHTILDYSSVFWYI